MHPQIAIAVDSVAQQVEHNTFNVGVLGSSPSRVTEKALNIVQGFFVSLSFPLLPGASVASATGTASTKGAAMGT